ncbi:MAG: hypothetical protein IBX71_09110 [Candidatus Desulforudis sp.]|nr:hypothetical protein [Desulforudis sp.]
MVENVHPDYQILVLEREISIRDLVKCPSAGDNLIMVSGAFGEQPKMKIRSPAGLQEVPLNLDLKPGWEYLRPVAINADGQGRISLCVETSGLSPGTGNSLGLAVGDFDGRDMRWRTVSEDLEISEAGGGTQMARWGDRIVIAEQHAEVKALDLETGRLSPLHEVNAHLRDFARDNIKAQEFCVAPTLYTGNDLLIVSWTPAAIEEDPSGGPFRWIPMTCILACSADGRIVGEIRAVEGSLTVIKDGKVTQELDVPEDRFPSCWRFPRE